MSEYGELSMTKYFPALLSLFILCTVNAYAQNPNPNSTQKGVVLRSNFVENLRDIHGRSPDGTARAWCDQGSDCHIVADASISDQKYQQLPVRFDFYVNNELVKSEISSAALPNRTIGLSFGSDIAEPPFNFTVVFGLIHPHGIFHSTITGAVKGVSFSTENAALDCTLTRNADTDNPTVYVANGVVPVSAGDSSVSIDFNAENIENSDDFLTAETSITLSGQTASGTLSISALDGEAVTGTVEGSNSELSSVQLSTAAGTTTLNCS